MTCKDCIHFDVCGIEKKIWGNIEQTNDNMCKDFKDKSRFIELPCMVGDTVFEIHSQVIKSFTVREIGYNDCGFTLIVSDENGMYFEGNADDYYLTRKEAEQALKEFNNET